MRRLKNIFRRYKLWIGFAGALLPLLLLLCMQYVWLDRLQETTAIARQVKLYQYVEGVLKEVAWFYGNSAERALNLPYSLFTQNKIEKAAYYFKKKPVQGAKSLFVMDYVSHRDGRLLFYDPDNHTMVKGHGKAERRSIYVACAPWTLLSHKKQKIESVKMMVDERDPDNYMILQPITDESSAVVGVAGMILDQDFFRNVLLPKVMKGSLPAFASEAGHEDLVLTVYNQEKKVIFATGKKAKKTSAEVVRWFPWVFTHHKLVLQSTNKTSEELARSSFQMNLTLSALLALVLLGGILLALRTASREMKLSEMKTDFVSNVSHELRTPLASIRVFGEFLRLGRARESGKVREYGEYIETESRRLSQLINNILDFSKIESGRKTYHFDVADIRDVLDEVLRTFDVRLRHSKFNITYDRPEGDLPEVRIDADAMAQAIHNLLDNAVKYSNDSRDIDVGVYSEDGEVRLSVKDHGIGISREQQAKIFERFHRVGTGAVHDVRGSGLGLAIVSHIVKAHGGRIVVKSEPGRGSNFSIVLPVFEQDDWDREPGTNGTGGDSGE